MAEEKRHYVLWLINAVQDWDKTALLSALTSASVAGKLRITAELGDREAPAKLSRGININDHEAAKARQPPYGKTEYTPLGALQHEGGHLDRDRFTDRGSLHLFDEYFVPIPVKCIGDPQALGLRVDQLRPRLGGPRLQQTDGAALDKITGTYEEYFAPGRDFFWKNYWDTGFSGAPTAANIPGALDLNEVRMHSKPGVGYYEMLVRWNERAGHEHDRHVLLGYSQGGIVGRFVAHLDEHVYGLGIVHGVVTVQSPNYGSPVARSETGPPLAEVVKELLLSLDRVPGILRGLVPADLKPLLAYLFLEAAKEKRAKGSSGLTIDKLDDEMENCIEHIRARVRSGQSASVRESRKNIGLLVSGRKWLSGMCSDRSGEKFAFKDINPERHNGSDGRSHVLRLISEPGHTIPHGAVVGCNPSLAALFGNGAFGLLVRFLGWAVGLSLDKVTRRYQAVLDESGRLPASAQPSYKALAALYNAGLGASTGLLDEPIPPRAHDCVIPSSHQLMHAPLGGFGAAPDNFLGNKINVDANHASGTGLSDGPPHDLKLVTDLMKALPTLDP